MPPKLTNQESALDEFKKEEKPKRKIRIFRVRQTYEVRKEGEALIRTNLSEEEFEKLMPNTEGRIYSNDLQEKIYKTICDSPDGFQEYDEDYGEFIANEEESEEVNFDWMVDEDKEKDK